MGKLLVIADEGDSCIATSRGLQLAAKLGHDVEVVAFEYDPLDRLARKKSEQASHKRAPRNRCARADHVGEALAQDETGPGSP